MLTLLFLSAEVFCYFDVLHCTCLWPLYFYCDVCIYTFIPSHLWCFVFNPVLFAIFIYFPLSTVVIFTCLPILSFYIPNYPSIHVFFFLPTSVNCAICLSLCLCLLCKSSERGCSLQTWRSRPSSKSRSLNWKHLVSNVSIWSFKSWSTQSGRAPTRYCRCTASPDPAETQGKGSRRCGRGRADRGRLRVVYF